MDAFSSGLPVSVTPFAHCGSSWSAPRLGPNPAGGHLRRAGGGASGGKPERVGKLQPRERVLASVGAANVPGAIISVDSSGIASIELSRPVCASVGDAIALSRRVGSAAAAHWRLVGRGEIVAGITIEPTEALRI